MNRLDELLSEAQFQRRRRRRVVLSASALIIASAVLVFLGTTYLDRLKVDIAPDDGLKTAQIEILGGLGLVLGTNIIAVKEDIGLRVSASGFKSQELSVSNPTWRRGKIDVVLKPLPAKLDVKAAPPLADIRWYLDDIFITQAPNLKIDLSEGEHTVRAEHPNYEVVEHEVSLSRDQSFALSLDLTPVQGNIQITSDPTGSRVMLNAVTVGKTPLQFDVQGGRHEIVVAHSNYAERKDQVEVGLDNRVVKRHYKLKLVDQTIKFSLSPQDGLLTVDHVALSAGQSTSILLPVNSRHVVQYSKPGYATQTLEFTVKPNASNHIQLSLPALYGAVNIQSEPVAQVSIDGVAMGQTPLELMLQTFPQTVTVSRAGYRSQSRTITPDENMPEMMFVNLVSERDHRLSTSPKDYVNSVGMSFKLFKQPDTFRMGSERHEPGAWANEFVRQIQLSRPFYAGVHEVSVDQYQQFSAPGQSAVGSREPITGISWLEAALFCNWLSNKEGFNPVYQFSGTTFVGSDVNADGYRLLTEAEWEWLARKAGRFQQTLFPWGNKTTIPVNSGNLADESAKAAVSSYIPQYNDGQVALSTTGLYDPNPVGIYDLAGNASEWTHDSYSLAPPLDNIVEVDPFDQSAAARRTIKGSNYQTAMLHELKAAFRKGGESSDPTVGFRVARYLY